MSGEDRRAVLARARQAGLTPGAFVAGLVAGVPVLTSGSSRGEHLGGAGRVERRDGDPCPQCRAADKSLPPGSTEQLSEYRAMLDEVAREVRGHLQHVSAVLADLRPSRMRTPATTLQEVNVSEPSKIDGVLVQWGERLFYPRNRIVKVGADASACRAASAQRAAAIRARIEATVVRRAPQVMVKVTGGGRGMAAIAAHFRYISKNGRLDVRGRPRRQLAKARRRCTTWPSSGATAARSSTTTSHRREAFNIMLSMPRGTDPLIVQRAAREFAQAELADHSYVMVLHDHQANPHVHLSVRAESRHGKRLNPRKADLQRWRETFAEKLRGWGIDAEATPAGHARRRPQLRASGASRPRRRAGSDTSPGAQDRPEARTSRKEAGAAWANIFAALRASDSPTDRSYAAAIERWVRERGAIREVGRKPWSKHFSESPTSSRRDDSMPVHGYFPCRGSRREAVRACSRGRRASRMSRNSPRVVSSLSGVD